MFNLKIARMKKKITQEELAEMISCTRNTIVAYEAGRIKPSLNKLCLIANILEVTTDYLLGRD